MTTAKLPNSELIAYQFKTMNEKFDEHKEDTNKRFDKLEKLIVEGFKSLPETYATKKEHDENKELIKKMQENQASIAMKAVIGAWSLIIGWIIWLIDIILKRTWII